MGNLGAILEKFRNHSEEFKKLSIILNNCICKILGERERNYQKTWKNSEIVLEKKF